MSLYKWDLQWGSPPWLLMKGAAGISFSFFQSVFQKSEGKLCSGFANSPCFQFNFYSWFTDRGAKMQIFLFRSQHVSSEALHANHWNCLLSNLERTKWGLCLNSANWHFTFICFCLSGIFDRFGCLKKKKVCDWEPWVLVPCKHLVLL